MGYDGINHLLIYKPSINLYQLVQDFFHPVSPAAAARCSTSSFGRRVWKRKSVCLAPRIHRCGHGHDQEHFHFRPETRCWTQNTQTNHRQPLHFWKQVQNLSSCVVEFPLWLLQLHWDIVRAECISVTHRERIYIMILNQKNKHDQYRPSADITPRLHSQNETIWNPVDWKHAT